ncbi:MAG: diaminobutyrate--2-oxoglutarate transaminase [Pseudomonadota bacterium]
MEIFNKFESKVRSYSRVFPRVFTRAEREFMWDDNGNQYLDFFSGAGSLNYGHNNPILKDKLLSHIKNNQVTQSLDLHTTAKASFLQSLNNTILAPRNLQYKVQFTGPTGTNAVEAAFKIARSVTGRKNIVAFTNGFHGMTLGSLAATGNDYYRSAAGVSLSNLSHLPYDGYLGEAIDTTRYIEKLLTDPGSGLDLPAAVIVEAIQGEGGCNAASVKWLRNLQALCKRHNILVIVDDIQAGCGRSGDFFSFEAAGIEPDIIAMSKSISGYGLPMAVVLMKPELDQWKPGQHNGTFRGNNMAFVTAEAAINHYWSDTAFANQIKRKGEYIGQRLRDIASCYDAGISTKGRGMFRGLNCGSGEIAKQVNRVAFDNQLILETCGAHDEVVKIFCPLTISDESLKAGMDIIESAVKLVMNQRDPAEIVLN